MLATPHPSLRLAKPRPGLPRPGRGTPESGHNHTMITASDAAGFAWDEFPRAELHALACRRRGGDWADELLPAWLAVQQDGWAPLRAAVATCGLIFGEPGAHPRDLANAVRKPPPARPASAEVRRERASWARQAMAERLNQSARDVAS